MWIVYAVLSAIFAGITSILVKCGIKETDSNVATALRTIVVLIFSWIMVLLVGSQTTIAQVDSKTWILLLLSGFATGASWLCYFRALQLGNINKVVPIDKSSTILTMLFAMIFLKEEISFSKLMSILLIGIGTFLMIQHKDVVVNQERQSTKWFFYAVLSAIFASLTAILGKVGIQNVESNLGTAIRTVVVLIMAWIVVFVTKKQHTVHNISKKELGYLVLSGIATGASWLCFYRGLQEGPASIVVPIDKLSILVTIAFSDVVFHERMNRRSKLGLILLVVGTLLLLR